jgi:hypothetical protein
LRLDGIGTRWPLPPPPPGGRSKGRVRAILAAHRDVFRLVEDPPGSDTFFVMLAAAHAPAHAPAPAEASAAAGASETSLEAQFVAAVAALLRRGEPRTLVEVGEQCRLPPAVRQRHSTLRRTLAAYPHTFTVFESSRDALSVRLADKPTAPPAPPAPPALRPALAAVPTSASRGSAAAPEAAYVAKLVAALRGKGGAMLLSQLGTTCPAPWDQLGPRFRNKLLNLLRAHPEAFAFSTEGTTYTVHLAVPHAPPHAPPPYAPPPRAPCRPLPLPPPPRLPPPRAEADEHELAQLLAYMELAPPPPPREAECCFCLDALPAVVLEPCGHAPMCAQCTARVMRVDPRCPLCRCVVATLSPLLPS